MRTIATLAISNHQVLVYEGQEPIEDCSLMIQVSRGDKGICKPRIEYMGNDIFIKFSKVKHG